MRTSERKHSLSTAKITISNLVTQLIKLKYSTRKICDLGKMGPTHSKHSINVCRMNKVRMNEKYMHA